MATATGLKAFRDRHGLTQDQLGNVLGVTRATVNNWETGRTPISARVDHSMLLLERYGSGVLQERAAGVADASAADVIEWINTAETGFRSVESSPSSDRWHSQKIVARREFEVSDLAAAAGLPAVRDMNFVSAGALVPEPRIGEVGSPLLLNSNLSRLGVVYATFKPDDILKSPFWSSLPVAEWLLENDELSDSAGNLMVVNPAIRTVGTSVKASRSLIKQTGGRGQSAIIRAILQSLTRAMDAAALLGNGGKEPAGLLNIDTPIIDAVALGFGGGLPNSTVYADNVNSWWVTVLETLDNAGIDSERVGVVAGPATKKYLGQVDFESANFWRQTEQGQTCGGKPAVVVPGIPEKTLIVGDFSTATIRHSEKVQLTMVELNPSNRHDFYAFTDCSIEFPFRSAFVRVENAW